MDTANREPGTFVWVDLSTPDVARSRAFYGHLFGWSFEDSTTDLGSYVVASIDERDVAGMMAQDPAMAAAGVPPAWTAFVDTDRLDDVISRVPDAGGSVVQPPVAIPGDARVAAVADPAGAVVALMEAPRRDVGMAWDRPGAVCWIECLSRDVTASRRFDDAVFGWNAEVDRDDYIVLRSEGRQVGGMMSMPPTVPVEAPSYWLVYFAVDDVEDACAAAEHLGGQVLEPTHDIDEGHFAILQDPVGAVFAIFQPRSPDEASRGPS